MEGTILRKTRLWGDSNDSEMIEHDPIMKIAYIFFQMTYYKKNTTLIRYLFAVLCLPLCNIVIRVVKRRSEWGGVLEPPRTPLCQRHWNS